jgi:hypothetical protein
MPRFSLTKLSNTFLFVCFFQTVSPPSTTPPPNPDHHSSNPPADDTQLSEGPTKDERSVAVRFDLFPVTLGDSDLIAADVASDSLRHGLPYSSTRRRNKIDRVWTIYHRMEAL